MPDTGNSHIVRFDANGNILESWGTRSSEGELPPASGKFVEPWDIAVDSQGDVYVADTWNMQVVIFSAEGNFVTKWPVQGWAGDSLDNKPYIAVDAENRVYITDPERYRVIVFSSAGAPLAAFGQYGPEEDAFGLPVGIASDSRGILWISDAGNNRLLKFDLWKQSKLS